MRNSKVTQTALVFRALADPTRRQVLGMLARRRELAAGDIARAFTVTRPAVARHVLLLRRAGLLAERRQGSQRLYRLRPEPLKQVDRWLATYRRFWRGSLAGLKDVVEHRPEGR